MLHRSGLGTCLPCSCRRLSANESWHKLRCAPLRATAPEPYIGNDGRRKATLEEAWKHMSGSNADSNTPSTSGRQLPWQLGFQSAERRLPTNEWIKEQLLIGFVSKELGLTQPEVAVRIKELQSLVPSSHERLLAMKPKIVAQLLQHMPQLAQTLVELKIAFPKAAVSSIIAKQPALALSATTINFQEAAARLHHLLPRTEIDKLVEDWPTMLDVASFEAAMQEAQRMMPGKDVEAMIVNNPGIVFSFQRGSDLIPYDPPNNSDG